MMKRSRDILFFLVIVLQLFKHSNTRLAIQEGVNLTITADNSLLLHSKRGTIIAQDDTEVLKDLRVHGDLHLNDSSVLALLQQMQETIQTQQQLITNLTEILQQERDNWDQQRREFSKIGRAFSYKSFGSQVYVGWTTLVCNVFHFNDFGNDTYNTLQGTFTAPDSGLYRFSIGGFTPATPLVPDTSIALAVFVNGVIEAMGGAQLSGSDSPIGTFTHLVYLKAGDVVTPMIYSSLQTFTMGYELQGYEIWFQGQYVRGLLSTV